MKDIKIPKDLHQEIVDDTGSIIDGDYIDNESKVKTNNYKDKNRPQTSDDFVDSTGGNNNWAYFAMGYSLGEDVDREIEQNIPQKDELSNTYDQPEIHNQLNKLLKNIGDLSAVENIEKDVKAIILKEIMLAINPNELKDEHRKEIANLYR